MTITRTKNKDNYYTAMKEVEFSCGKRGESLRGRFGIV